MKTNSQMRKGMEREVQWRATWIMEMLPKELDNQTYMMAGGCLNGHTIRDIDLFMQPAFFDEIGCRNGGNITDWPKGIIYTMHDRTASHIIQCIEWPDTFNLKELIGGFDFSHCEVGVLVKRGEVVDVLVTDAFHVWKVGGISKYRKGSPYPHLALRRAINFNRRGIIREDQMNGILKQIMKEINKAKELDFSLGWSGGENLG